MKRFILLVLGVLAFSDRAFANPIQTTPSVYGSAVVTSSLSFVEWSATANNGAGGWKVRISGTWSGTEPVNAAGVVGARPSDGGPYYLNDSTMSRDGSHSVTVTSTLYAPPESQLVHFVYVGYNGVFYATEETLTVPPGAAPSYKITVTIPANDTENVIQYFVYQGETVVAQASSEPGQGPQLLQITDLETNAPVVIKEVSYIKEIAEDPLNPGVYIVVGTVLNEIRTVSTGTPTIQGSTAPAPEAPKPAPPPIIKTTPTAPPAAPTPAPAPTPPVPHIPIANPTPKAPPNTTPTGTGGATKEDIERQTNQLADVLDNANTEAAKNANGIIGAINTAATANHTGQNAIISAVNTAASSAHTSATAQIAALNKAQGALDRINASLSGLGTNAAFTNSKLTAIQQAIEGGPDVAPASYPATFTGTLAATNTDAVSGLVAKLPAVPDVLPTDIGSSSHFVFSLKFPPLTQTFVVDVDMAPYSTPIGFVRGIMKSLLTILFFFLVVNTLKKAVS